MNEIILVYLLIICSFLTGFVWCWIIFGNKNKFMNFDKK